MEETFAILRRLHQTRRGPSEGGEETGSSGSKARKPDAVRSPHSRS